ncbi:uncharacterized protein LOC125668372 [Ostrea edulis]|uniref:uncharacterized protein LOC125668372 n=1 Tax=Ostrea edulis TaxID=37623 RepID=UPI0024AF1A11|nr:uncharacterized protein LOC125668372 [Ostrea edulis]XP_048758456.2 uncharacterized protein LOC125668372 [Ostrea edulis]XP_056004988.1 uncharacterized protein LOC125668372 [Ostrea edulis]
MAETLSGTDDSESETSDDSDVNDSLEDGGSEASAMINDHVVGISREEDNFLRYFLQAHLAVDAVRIWFDTIVPPRKLEKHLKRHKRKAFKNCSDEQKGILFPENPVTSENFDITLFYKIIRNTTDVKRPTKGWGEEPEPSDTEPADDLERVRICRNSLSHCPPSVSDGEFKRKWKDLSEVIRRLGKGQLDRKLDSLKDKILDCSTRNSLRLDLAALRERVHDVEISIAHHIPPNLKEQHRKLLQKWREDDKFFLEIHSYKTIIENIKRLDHVTVTGGGGIGKTSLIRHVALQLAREGFEILPMSSIDEIIICGNLGVKQVFVVDDVLGVHGVDVGLYNSWMAKSERIFNLLESGSKLLMTCRSVVLKESKQLDSLVTHLDHVIDLGDEEHQLTDEDKNAMLGIHCRHRQLRQECFENFCLSNSLPMFPLLCRLFSSDEKYQEMGQNFFHLPYRCLFSELNKMREMKKMQYASLVYCVMKDNRVSSHDLDLGCLEDVYNCCRVNKSTSDWKLRNALRVLVGSYLVQDTDGRFSFIHDKLFEIVAVHFGKQFPDCLIKYVTSSFIYKFIEFDENGSIVNESRIAVSEIHFPVLVNCVICDIRRFHLYEVFNCNILKSTAFVSEFCKVCRDFSLHEIKTLLFEDTHCEMLYEETNRKSNEMEKISDMVFDNLENGRGVTKRTLSEWDCKFKILNRQVFKVLYWIIGYGHVHLLSSVVELVHSKTLSENRNIPGSGANVTETSEIMFGKDLESQSTCLALACASGDVEMVNLVLDHVKPECINHKYDNADKESRPLFVASLNGRSDIVNVLLREGASDEQNCAITVACLFGHDEVVANLITHGCDVNFSYAEIGPSLFYASAAGYIEIVKNLIKHGAIVNFCNCKGMSPLYAASRYGHLEIVKYLIESGADVNLCDNDGISPLYIASYKGHLEIVKNLIESGADVNLCDNDGNFPLSIAYLNDHLEIVKYLIKSGADVNLCDNDGVSPLSIASYKGHLEIVKNLIESGADVNLCDNDGDSPLSSASGAGHLEIVIYLMEKNADVNIGVSCLSCACSGGHLDVVKYLTDKVDVNQVGVLCDPALHAASSCGHLNIVEYLIEHGADINLLSSSNDSPLYCAAEKDKLEVVRCLVQHGADINQGLEIACQCGHEQVVDYLLNYFY